ncbi:uncharacterized protein LOC107882272 [Acyrthosiphon pisum]|uniref:YqaJ viral recombinase domain-containing protein n=1 Tax=Acyrthosiphon pisum TaxID=7029 RepID=A0A8R2D112_ACYPI|nr:uncharacterized protein LOC107882272 [Acyrthosiphon pisum]|eukprot:XP_016655892.1 PREDICTED: uncharacterized protein LOC107882272 [Acyrthosiphon pisum]
MLPCCNYLARNSLDEIDTLSSTDIRCQWTKLREPSLEQFKPVPISKFCCVGNSIDCTLSQSKTSIRSALISAAPYSAIALHSKGRKSFELSSDVSSAEIHDEPFQIISNQLLDLISEYSVLNLGDCCQKVYDCKVALKMPPSKIRNLSLNDNSFWHQIRQFKITGSRCHSLYTYYMSSNKSDEKWSKKASSYFWPKSFSNKFVKHGIKYEQVARVLYAETTKQKVIQSGFVVHYQTPWLGYSPDGIVLDGSNVPIKLLEIKCPYLGSSKSVPELINDLKYIIKNSDGSFSLNKRDAYYAQVQLGLVMLNLETCDFVIYSSLEHKYIILKTDFDYEYCKKMLCTLKIIYFEKLIHDICNMDIVVQ